MKTFFLIEDHWKCTSIFPTIIHSGDKKCKLVINGGSSMNVVSKDVVKLLNFKVEPHPNPFTVAWVNDHTLPVTQRCLVSIQMGDYKDEIYCEVLPMDVAHVLLGRLGFIILMLPILVKITFIPLSTWVITLF